MTKQKIRKAIIPAAGLGTRFLPATKAQPKEMLPIIDKPSIQYIVEEAIASGIEDILIVTGRNKRAIEDHFDRSIELELFLSERQKWETLREVQDISNLVDIHFIRQKEPRGLGHAIYCARSFVGNEPFAVLLGDDIIWNESKPALKQLIQVYEETQQTVIGVQQVPLRDVSKYGIVSGHEWKDGVWKLDDLVEKPAVSEAPTQYAIVGRYVIQPEIFSILERTDPGNGGEIQLTDALRILCHDHDMYAKIVNGERHDIGDKLGYLKAMIGMALYRTDMKDDLLDYLRELMKSQPQQVDHSKTTV
ncbi:UTP--glucose-1-phosphate uridylyltransferase GalU [Fodinisporobacter ferrooxydans]|uniref:UTP--glucose-1-phosphate uridylyltransferase n=1 Tax=Fodinisporobacter ferrooxydans TaxID=2901836 RepID=A0ABY4CJR2_9BACL|nr:UTP--glucose-1-phosphate uridylyltransferase GalU [Alicyclobacillaceae bacterium MYW30-H2]